MTAKEDVGSFQTLDYIFELKFRKNELLASKDDSITLESNKKILSSTNKLTRKNSANKGDDSDNNYQDLTDVVLNVRENPAKKFLNKKKHQMFIDYNSAQVESFLVSDKPYQQLSDHFGLSVDLKFKEIKPNEC